MNETIISLDKVNKTYVNEKLAALHDITLSVNRGEFVAIIGASGCGKSTLLKIIAGLETAESGTVNRPTETSMVFQSGALMPWLTAMENVRFGLHIQNSATEKIAKEYLNMLGLSNFENKYPRELSGGQRQRVGIARALAVKPDVLLMDEPFSALDPKTTHELHEDVIKIWRETKITVVMVSHLIEEAATLAQKVVLMDAGSIKETFSIDISYPRHERGHEVLTEVEKIRRVFFGG